MVKETSDHDKSVNVSNTSIVYIPCQFLARFLRHLDENISSHPYKDHKQQPTEVIKTGK